MVTVAEIPKGYKETEAGVIPEAWKAEPIGNFLEFKNGLNKAKEFFGNGTPIVNYMDVYFNAGLLCSDIKGKVTLTSDEIRSYRVKKGDVFFTRTSETVDEIGISAVMLEDIKDTVFSGFVLRGRSKNENLHLLYKKYCFRFEKVRRQICSTSSYTTRALTNGRLLSKIFVAFPLQLEEQELIASALSDIDVLIISLEKLIAKKRNIKQGTMQQLLTGKKRLPGFNGEWGTNAFGSMIEINKGQQLNKSKLTALGEYPDWNGGVVPSGYTSQWNTHENTITISEGGNSCGFVNYSKTKFWLGGHCYSLKISNTDLNKEFLYQFLKFKEKSIMNLRIGSGLPNIQKKNLNEFELFIPRNKLEQAAITTILSDMDVEIEELEQKRNKYIMIKQGMMQQLLTGQIRVYEPGK